MSDNERDTLRFDTDDLYRIDTFTDQRSGSIRRMTPVDADGNDDPSRPVRYIGEASAMTPAGTIPLSFELEGDSLARAAEGFADGAQQAFQETLEELKRMQREQQQSIMVPGQDGRIDVPGGGMGGGKIQF
ncbi:hypothetical protein HFP89_08955 [Wenzhouxiangella sp. XN79A]|uniref:hypothetical protein n=1 Tax=Wenzhouxiangella sp. XN79A TaxID=2724193 RepID=UPI00144A6334|nr:hypothetical protein [Wenzhouxiangella sp. XN79A]NKI35294.1 hypothetical protein [Wenzhouxiangella sp. XN79A]